MNRYACIDYLIDTVDHKTHVKIRRYKRFMTHIYHNVSLLSVFRLARLIEKYEMAITYRDDRKDCLMYEYQPKIQINLETIGKYIIQK